MPNGLVSASFYVEGDALPDCLDHALTPDGIVKSEIERFPRPSATRREVERRIQVTVLLQPQIARAVAAWLNEKADLLEQGHED